MDEDYASSPLTYGEAAFAAEQVSKGLSQALNISKKKYNKPMPKEEWWLFYPSFLKAADTQQAVQEVKLLLYGTPDNVKEAAPWTAYTSEGIMGFEGLSMDSYIDHEIKVLIRNGEMIHLSAVVSDEVVYRNVWLAPENIKNESLHRYDYPGISICKRGGGGRGRSAGGCLPEQGKD